MTPNREQLAGMLFEMLPGLFIGGWPAAAKACRSKILGPRVFVVNLANGKPMVSRRGVMIKVNDDRKPQSMQILDQCIDGVVRSVRAEMEKGLPVIVHCHAGRQRSAAVIAAYIMIYEGLDLEATILYMRARKPDVFLPSVNFLSVLQRVERDHQVTKK
jgi:protein-tyrosine phosphatase